LTQAILQTSNFHNHLDTVQYNAIKEFYCPVVHEKIDCVLRNLPTNGLRAKDDVKKTPFECCLQWCDMWVNKS